MCSSFFFASGRTLAGLDFAIKQVQETKFASRYLIISRLANVLYEMQKPPSQ